MQARCAWRQYVLPAAERCASSGFDYFSPGHRVVAPCPCSRQAGVCVVEARCRSSAPKSKCTRTTRAPTPTWPSIRAWSWSRSTTCACAGGRSSCGSRARASAASTPSTRSSTPISMRAAGPTCARRPRHQGPAQDLRHHAGAGRRPVRGEAGAARRVQPLRVRQVLPPRAGGGSAGCGGGAYCVHGHVGAGLSRLSRRRRHARLRERRTRKRPPTRSSACRSSSSTASRSGATTASALLEHRLFEAGTGARRDAAAVA